MRAEFAERLRCPHCHAERAFDVAVDTSDAREVREGSLVCSRCGHVAGVRNGIIYLLHDPPEFVVLEAAGLERFADFMRRDGWTRQKIMELPYIQDGYWYAQAVLMEQTLDTMPFKAGETILDVGSNTCWATATFAKHGLDATALDISDHQMQGLKTADWQFEDKKVFFERVLGVMFDLPFADASFRYVWCCEVLHHNHRPNLARTYREIYRVLEPGGQLIVANEPLRTLMTPRLDPGHEVAEFHGHEHAYVRASYTRLARRAGFDVDVRGPRYHGIFRPGGIGLSDRMTTPQILKAAAGAIASRHESLRKATLASRAYIRGGTALHMVCTKPGL
jgi:SAM-dependent methyltransferase/uncharacterized protein YbaR (Trm112 family)